MYKSKKYPGIVCLIIISMLLLSGCGASSNSAQPAAGNPAGGNAAAAADDHKFRLVEPDGTEFIRDTVPERIIVISVATAKIMDSLGIEMAGITRTMRPLPDKLAALPTVGFPMEPDLEAITALNPDLVIISSDFKNRLIEKMTQHNIPVFFLANQSYADSFSSIEMLGEAFGREEKAGRLLKEMKDQEKAALSLAKDKPSPRVLILFGAGGSFLMARDTSYVGSMVKMLGGKNITDGVALNDEMSDFIPMSIEQVVALNPQIILRISHGTVEETQRLYEEEFLKNPIWREVSAQQNNRVYDLPSELFFANPGLEVVDALKYLAEIMYE